MSKEKKALSLNKETVTNLNAKELSDAKGGTSISACEPDSLICWNSALFMCYSEYPTCAYSYSTCNGEYI
jgi:hypothetical protein